VIVLEGIGGLVDNSTYSVLTNNLLNAGSSWEVAMADHQTDGSMGANQWMIPLIPATL
jgi:hypothetical protein